LKVSTIFLYPKIEFHFYFPWIMCHFSYRYGTTRRAPFLCKAA
jgi:hypothetical protein